MSSSCLTPSRLAQAEASGQVLVVAMNEVKFVAFGDKSAIGTRDLAGCSVVIIASARGAILAHIPPRPTPDTSDPYAGDDNVRRLMKRVERLYHQQRHYLGHTDTYLVFAIYNGTVALPDQKKIIEEKIAQMGLSSFSSSGYITPRDPTNQAHGTILVDSLDRLHHRPVVYAEDRRVLGEEQLQQSMRPNQFNRTATLESCCFHKHMAKDAPSQPPEWPCSQPHHLQLRDTHWSFSTQSLISDSMTRILTVRIHP